MHPHTPPNTGTTYKSPCKQSCPGRFGMKPSLLEEFQSKKASQVLVNGTRRPSQRNPAAPPCEQPPGRGRGLLTQSVNIHHMDKSTRNTCFSEFGLEPLERECVGREEWVEKSIRRDLCEGMGGEEHQE